MLNNFKVTIFVSSMLVSPFVFSDQLKSGNYEGLHLAINDSGSFVGFFEQTAGLDQKPTCQFSIKGTVKEGVGEGYLNAYDSNKYAVQILPNGNSVDIQLAENKTFKCISSEEMGPTISLERVVDAKWKDLRVAKEKRVYFYAESNEATKRKAYIVKGDLLGVVSEKGKWLEVEYEGSSSTTKGWVKKSETAEIDSL